MFNPLKMAGDMKGMEKMLKPALEKFMNDSGFVKKAELEELKKRVEELVFAVEIPSTEVAWLQFSNSGLYGGSSSQKWSL